MALRNREQHATNDDDESTSKTVDVFIYCLNEKVEQVSMTVRCSQSKAHVICRVVKRQMIDVVAERGDKQELGRMLQLVLGCAVNCDDKHEYIRRIMNMEEAVQHDVMKAIQEVRHLNVFLVFLYLAAESQT